jgi:hypothetical protein
LKKIVDKNADNASNQSKKKKRKTVDANTFGKNHSGGRR